MKKQLAPKWSMEFTDEATTIEVRLPARSKSSRETIIKTIVTKGPLARKVKKLKRGKRK